MRSERAIRVVTEYPRGRRPVSPIILPPPEGPTRPVNWRLPEKLIKELDEVATASGHDRTAVVVHFLRWALHEYREEQEKERQKKGR